MGYHAHSEPKPVPGLRPVQARPRFGPGGKVSKAQSDHSLSETLSLTVRAGMPLSQLNIALLDTDTKLILAEKEQALLGIGFYEIHRLYVHTCEFLPPDERAFLIIPKVKVPLKCAPILSEKARGHHKTQLFCQLFFSY